MSLVALTLSLLGTVVSCQSTQIREKKARLQKSTQSLKVVKVLVDDPKTERPQSKWGPEEKILAATLKAEEPAKALEEIKAVQKEHQVESIQALLAKTNPAPRARIPSAIPESTKTLEPQRQFLKGFASHRLTIQDLSTKQDEVFAALEKAIQRSPDLQLSTYLVRSGQSLQKISFELYSTTRRWPEIFLLNRAQLQTWNTVRPGQELKVVAPRP